MSIHPLFPATRPALAPIILPIILPLGLDDLLWERATANIIADMAHKIPSHIIARQAAWANRLDARIAQVVS